MNYNPACTGCLIVMTPRKNGVMIIEVDNDDQPLRLRMADLWECPTCGNQVTAGYSAESIAERHEDKFIREIEEAYHMTWVYRVNVAQKMLPELDDEPITAMAERVHKEASHASMEPYVASELILGTLDLDGSFNSAQLRIIANWLDAQDAQGAPEAVEGGSS